MEKQGLSLGAGSKNNSLVHVGFSHFLYLGHLMKRNITYPAVAKKKYAAEMSTYQQDEFVGRLAMAAKK